MTQLVPLPAVSDLAVRLGVPIASLVEEDLARAEVALEDATTTALAEILPTIAARWDGAVPRPVRLVILKAARREYENPRGINQETLEGHTVGLSESSGVYLTGREIQAVRRAATGRRSGFVGSVRFRTPSE